MLASAYQFLCLLGLRDQKRSAVATPGIDAIGHENQITRFCQDSCNRNLSLACNAVRFGMAIVGHIKMKY